MRGKIVTPDTDAWLRSLAPLASMPTEMATVAYLTASGALLGARHFVSRSAASVEVSIRAIVIDALATDARVVLLAHNHPSGDVEPSAVDVALTRRLFAALAAVEVRLYDHLIVARDRRLSFRERCLL